MRPQVELRRFALLDAPDGIRPSVVADPTRRAPGRGAWTCGTVCTERAVARRAFARAFKRAVQLTPDLLESTTSG